MFHSLIVLLFLVKTGVISEYLYTTNIFSSSQNDGQTYFGYSLQLQHDREFGGRIIVGAPKINKNSDPRNGVVYSCPIVTKKCDEIILNSNELDNDIGLGFAVDALQSENGFIVTCAPRWTNKQNQSTIGMCFLLKNTSLLNELRPLENIPLLDKTLYLSTFGEVGFSAHLIHHHQNDVRLLLGAPGVYAWTGTPALYDNFNNISPIVANVRRTDKKIATYSYFGYSVSSGKFNASDTRQVFYVAGAPRNNELYGSVNIFSLEKNEPFRDRFMFRGTQFGEYFGASLAVGHVVGDPLDDLIIGAPTHTTDNSDNDVGCIYVFRALPNRENLKFSLVTKIIGERRSAKFGFALSYLGDLNNDGYGEIAVGAPYYYDDRGAVYIYFGSHGGLQMKQRILASEIDSTLRGFGFSLSRGLDVDNNTNNDLAVGAYISGQVVLMNSRPTIKIQTKLDLHPDSQLNINTTDLMVEYCVDYKSNINLIPYDIYLKLFIMNTQDVSFQNGKQDWTKTIQLKGEMKTCETFSILVNGHVFNDINLRLDYNISETHLLKEKFKPFEEHYSPSMLNIPFTKGCSTNICKPIFHLTKYSEINWIIGSSRTLNFSILMENFGEPSYNTELVINVMPEHLKCSRCPIYCDNSQNTVSSSIRCNLKNPILSQESKNISFELDATGLNPNDVIIYLNTSIITSIVFEIPLKVDVKFEILTKSQPEELSDDGIQTLTHQYNIKNVGLTQFDTKLLIFLPYQINGREFLQGFSVTGCTENQTALHVAHQLSNNNFLFEGTTADNTLFINCSNVQGHLNISCHTIECQLTNSNTINVTMMIDASVLLDELGNEGPIIFSSFVEPQDSAFVTLNSYIWTKLINKQQQEEASITIYLVTGILGSLLVVCILIFVLYKCGFFRKKHLPNEYERGVLLPQSNE